jgi:hypothetical protein
LATFDAILIKRDSAGLGDFVDKQEQVYVDPIREPRLGEVVDNSKEANPKSFDAVKVEKPWFDQIIVEPTEIDFDFIVDNIAREFKILSTFRRHEDTKPMTVFNELNFDGLQSLGVVVPNDVEAQCDNLYTLIALQDGPATQASQIVTQIGGDTFTINITGLRVALFPFLPDWNNGVTIGLVFKTVIFKTSNFVEQRRAIHKEPRNRLAFSIAVKSVAHRNLLRQLSKKIVGIPWYNDFIRVTNISGTTVDVSTNLNELAFLPIARFICFIDKKDITNNEVVEISSFTQNQIICSKDVTFVGEDTFCYPIFLATIRVQDENFPAPNIATYTIIAEEI